jgi:protein-S-isoprenylcysteine O-methyltransferase Ste14
MIFNPICTAGFAWAGWTFFDGRIPDEEEKLHKFFGKQYEQYCFETPIRIPFLDAKAYIKHKDYK